MKNSFEVGGVLPCGTEVQIDFGARCVGDEFEYDLLRSHPAPDCTHKRKVTAIQAVGNAEDRR